MIDPSMNEIQHLEIREKHYKFNERSEWLEHNGIDALAARNFVSDAGIMHPINQAQLKEALRQIEEYAVRGFTATRIAGEFWGK